MTDPGELIKRYRTEKGMTISELAKLSGVTHPTISSYENGKSSPSFEIFVKLMRILGYRILIVSEKELSDKYGRR